VRGLLERSIAARGVVVPVVVDRATGAIVDGHARAEIADALGVGFSVEVRHFETAEEISRYVLEVNLGRRHLTIDQRRDITRWLCGELRWSATKVAEVLRVGRQTTYRDLALLRATDPAFRMPGASAGRLRRLRSGDVRPYVRRKAPASPSLSGRMSEGIGGRQWLPGCEQDVQRLRHVLRVELTAWLRHHRLHFLGVPALAAEFSGVVRAISVLPPPPPPVRARRA
jgi:hypothetical protein